MASLDDLKGIFKSMTSSTMSQTNSIKTILNMQQKIDEKTEKLIENSNTIMNVNSQDNPYNILIDLGKEQVKFLQNIFKIQNEINEREKLASRLKPDTSVVAPKEEKQGEPKVSEKVEKKPPVGAGGIEDFLGIPTGILAAAAALGLAFAGMRGWEVDVIKKIKGALGGIGDSIVNGVKIIKNGILSVFGMDSNGKPLPNSVLDSITKNPWIKKLTDGISKIIDPIKKMFGTVVDNAGAFAKTVGKILKPIGILFSAFDGIKAGFEAEGDIFDKLSAGISAFIGDFIGAPLDLLKSIASWAMSKLGFENAAEYLDSFSFETIINNMFSTLFSGVKSALAVVGDLFTFGEEDKTALGLLGKLTDLVYAPVNMAINFVRGLFGFEESEEPFKLQDWITEKVTAIWDFFKEIIPSIDDIKKAALNLMPDWLRKLVGAPERTAAEIVNEKVEENNTELQRLEAKKTAIEVANATPTAEGSMPPQMDTSKIDADIAAIKEKVNAPNPRIDIIKQELKTLRDEKAAIDIANATPMDDGSTAPMQETFGIDAKIKNLEAELKKETTPATTVVGRPEIPSIGKDGMVVGKMIPNLDMLPSAETTIEPELNAEIGKEANKKPVTVGYKSSPDRLERIFAEQQSWTQHLERINKTVGNDKVPVTGGWASALEPIPSVDTNKKPITDGLASALEPMPSVGRMIPNLDIPKEIAPTAFKTPSRADVYKSATKAVEESTEIIEKPYTKTVQEEQNKASDFMNKVEAITESIKELNTNNNVNYAPMTDASSKTYVGGNTTTIINAPSSSKNDLDYYFAH